jgi:hypothetical protein
MRGLSEYERACDVLNEVLANDFMHITSSVILLKSVPRKVSNV